MWLLLIGATIALVYEAIRHKKEMDGFHGD
jgi:hypothetical protein